MKPFLIVLPTITDGKKIKPPDPDHAYALPISKKGNRQSEAVEDLETTRTRISEEGGGKVKEVGGASSSSSSSNKVVSRGTTSSNTTSSEDVLEQLEEVSSARDEPGMLLQEVRKLTDFVREQVEDAEKEFDISSPSLEHQASLLQLREKLDRLQIYAEHTRAEQERYNTVIAHRQSCDSSPEPLSIDGDLRMVPSSSSSGRGVGGVFSGGASSGGASLGKDQEPTFSEGARLPTSSEGARLPTSSERASSDGGKASDMTLLPELSRSTGSGPLLASGRVAPPSWTHSSTGKGCTSSPLWQDDANKMKGHDDDAEDYDV